MLDLCLFIWQNEICFAVAMLSMLDSNMCNRSSCECVCVYLCYSIQNFTRPIFIIILKPKKTKVLDCFSLVFFLCFLLLLILFCFPLTSFSVLVISRCCAAHTRNNQAHACTKWMCTCAINVCVYRILDRNQ